MRLVILCLTALITQVALPARQSDPEFNVNSRYTVESVEMAPSLLARLSTGLRKDLQKLVGEKLDTERLDGLRERIRQEIGSGIVRHRVERGRRPESVRVIFEVARKGRDLRLTTPRLVYHAKQGWSGGVTAELRIQDYTAWAGVVSNGDDLAERYVGVRAGLERKALLGGRMDARFLFEDFHLQWHTASNASAAQLGSALGAELYAYRRNLEPSVTLELGHYAFLDAGVSVQNMDFRFPAARRETSSALKTTLRLSRHWENPAFPSSLEAGYSLHAATKLLGSGYVYNRHTVQAAFTVRHGPHGLRTRLQAGAVRGQAPSYERFVLGNSQTLRGWNKFDLAPLGADKVVHGSVEYSFHGATAFYDAGAVWSAPQSPCGRHALGAGLRWKGLFFGVGFPLREGKASPAVIMAVDL